MLDGIKVNKDVLYDTYPSLEVELNKLLNFSEGLNRNLSIAAVKFDSENFKRASNIISTTQKNLSNSLVHLKKLRGYFEKLQKIVEEYSNCNF